MGEAALKSKSLGIEILFDRSYGYAKVTNTLKLMRLSETLYEFRVILYALPILGSSPMHRLYSAGY